jgi:hypothetical protein
MSKPEIRNNIKTPMFKIQNKVRARPWLLCFGHLCFGHLDASSFGIRISDFRVFAKWVKYQPQNHDFTLPKSEAELLRHGAKKVIERADSEARRFTPTFRKTSGLPLSEFEKAIHTSPDQSFGRELRQTPYSTRPAQTSPD